METQQPIENLSRDEITFSKALVKQLLIQAGMQFTLGEISPQEHDEFRQPLLNYYYENLLK